MKTFVLHDETVNTYGFRMLTSGCSLEAFRANPVMLYNHDDWELPIGRWQNVRIEGSRILADADFDVDDPRAREIARKVEAGYLVACSVGAWVEECSSEPALYVDGQTEPTVTRWSLREASICNIPANHHALALYDAMGARVREADYSTILELTDKKQSILITNPQQQKTEDMNLSDKLISLLTLSSSASDEELVTALEERLDRLADLEKSQEEARAREAKALSDRFAALSSKARQDGRLTEEQAEPLRTLYDAAPEATIRLLELMPERQPIAPLLKDDSTKDDDLVSLSWDELDRQGRLEELRDREPEVYDLKYKQRFASMMNEK